ncbi:MAG TPA: HD-GYP domain-containing protein [Symbiobacteriaceae bacterium]|nr:HD-GYP domain-containing protein [Symbiobacteriaceae bacterium]
MLTAITVTLIIGIAVATSLRLVLHMPLGVPVELLKTVAPLLVLPWLWHLRGWPEVAWVEATTYNVMVLIAQLSMEVNVTSALFLIPVIGVIHRHRWLALYSAVLGTAAYAFLLYTAPMAVGGQAPLLQFGAHTVLQGAMVLLFTGVISLAEQAERTVVQARMTEQMAMQWAASIEARDHYTGGHVARVTRYAMVLAPHISHLGMNLELFQLACILHDVGKIAVPDHILNKPGTLTPEERRVMESHATRGYDLVLRTRVPLEVARVVRHHHERWDGRGYPDGLQGTDISVAARVLAVADAFDAMTSDRPYRAALSLREAREQIMAGAGGQFDPAVVAAFVRVFPRLAELHQTTAAKREDSFSISVTVS